MSKLGPMDGVKVLTHQLKMKIIHGSLNQGSHERTFTSLKTRTLKRGAKKKNPCTNKGTQKVFWCGRICGLICSCMGIEMWLCPSLPKVSTLWASMCTPQFFLPHLVSTNLKLYLVSMCALCLLKVIMRLIPHCGLM
jgi:hypothetical protein